MKIATSIRNILGICLAVVAMGLLTSCGGGSTDELPIDETIIDEPDDEISQAQKVFYTLPSPFEVAALLKGSGATFDEEVLNSADNLPNYSTSRAQALNLGIYGADLSYASMFEQTNSSMQYLTCVQKLTDDLGISEAFDKGTMERLERNQNNKDSIQQIVSDAYLMANAFLKDNERSNTSALILAGGWVEGLYIATRLAAQGEPSEDLILLIAEQKYSLENLISLLESYEGGDVSDILADMNALNDFYIKLEASATSDTELTSDSETGMAVIGGGDELNITPEQLAEISTLAANIRNKYTAG